MNHGVARRSVTRLYHVHRRWLAQRVAAGDTGPMDYIRFILRNWRLLGFGFVLSFGSSFGQTFFISLSSAEIRDSFGLTHGAFGLAFTVATLTSGVCLVWAGRLIDRLDLRLFSALVIGGLIAGMVALSFAGSLAALVVALFLLRFCGQGLMIHTTSTTMARYFDRDRGKALSIGLLGQPLGEAVLPIVAVGFIVAVGWRDAWALSAAGMITVSLLLVPWLLRGHGTRHREFLSRTLGDSGSTVSSGSETRQWSRGDVLRDPRFYLLAPVVLAFPFIGTGLFFHQVHIAETRGWPLELLASAFVIFAFARVMASLLFGPAIDRFGATRLVTLPLVPLIAALLAIMVSDSPLVPFIYLGSLGLSIGMLIPLLGAVWSELYGVLHIGAIKAMSTGIIVLGSATSPAIFGSLIDKGVTIGQISAFCLVYVVAAGLLVALRFRQ